MTDVRYVEGKANFFGTPYLDPTSSFRSFPASVRKLLLLAKRSCQQFPVLIAFLPIQRRLNPFFERGKQQRLPPSHPQALRQPHLQQSTLIPKRISQQPRPTRAEPSRKSQILPSLSMQHTAQHPQQNQKRPHQISIAWSTRLETWASIGMKSLPNNHWIQNF